MLGNKMDAKRADEAFIAKLSGKLDKGYMRHDEFQRGGERRIVRRFPVYGEEDSNAEARGGSRLVVYTLRGNRLVIADTKLTIPEKNNRAVQKKAGVGTRVTPAHSYGSDRHHGKGCPGDHRCLPGDCRPRSRIY